VSTHETLSIIVYMCVNFAGIGWNLSSCLSAVKEVELTFIMI